MTTPTLKERIQLAYDYDIMLFDVPRQAQSDILAAVEAIDGVYHAELNYGVLNVLSNKSVTGKIEIILKKFV